MKILSSRRFPGPAWDELRDVEYYEGRADGIATTSGVSVDEAVLLGDSRWDIESAARAGVSTVAVITGGWSEQELRDHGAVAVFDSLVELRERLHETPFVRG